MQQEATIFRIFIASPSDLGEERKALREVVNQINEIFSRETDWRIELLGWEDTMPGGGRPQALINIDVDKADLFVGCLWHRWGTPSGSHGKTGFEEEFERAWHRREETGAPDIWLFFKTVSEEQQKDPGDQLKKVLAFRKREEKARRLLFNQFTDVEDWKRRIGPLLHRQLLALLRRSLDQKAAQSPQAQHTTLATPVSVSSGSKLKKSVARASVVTLLRRAGDELASQSIPAFREWLGDTRCVRLLLFATALYWQKIQAGEFGPHEVNSVYWHRRKLRLIAQEFLFLLKIVVDDSSLTKPGWYWAHRWKAKMSGWLPWLIEFDNDERGRAVALHFATETAFPLRSTAAKRALYNALNDNGIGVRFGALAYFATHGRTAALPELRRLLSDPDSRFSSEAKSTIHAIKLRLRPEKEMKQILEEHISLSDTLLNALSENISRLSSGTLEKCLNHTSPVLREQAAAELHKRHSLSLPSSLQLVTDDSRSVRKQGFYGLIDHNAAPAPSEIRAQLSGYRLSTFSFAAESVNPDEVIAYYFSKQTADILWTYVDSVDGNSHLALRALGEFFTSNRNLIRDALIDDFEQRVAAAKVRRDQSSLLGYTPLFGEDPIETERKNLRTVSLALLADHPDPADKKLFLRFLSSELSATDQTIACLRGLSHLAHSDTIESVKPFLSSGSGAVQAAAARAFLSLAPDWEAAIRTLLSAKSEHIIWIIVAISLERRAREIWEQLKPLLTDPSEEIRRLVCYYATSLLERKQLLAALTEYLKSGWYYYNVVVLLDRSIYAPPNVRTYFSKQEVAHFAKLTKDATRGWPGLTFQLGERDD